MMKKNDFLVLIPVYNAFDGLMLSLDSIQEQVDVLIIDDGSLISFDESLLSKYDLNFYYHKVTSNVGITRALNLGLEIAKEKGYKYIARLDAGDIVTGLRFHKQCNLMKENNLALLGTYVRFCDTSGNKLFDFKPPIGDHLLSKALKRYNPFVHPSVMLDLDKVIDVGGYPTNYPALEDWALFLKLSKKFKINILADFHLNYIIDPNSISSIKRKSQARSKVKLLWDNFNFDFNSIVGLTKNIIIMHMPRGFLTNIKRLILK